MNKQRTKNRAAWSQRESFGPLNRCGGRVRHEGPLGLFSASRMLLLLAALSMIGTMKLHAADPIVVMTFNIRYLNEHDGPDHWQRRTDAVVKTIAEADVVGLQEARKPQIDDLVERLPNFQWYGVGRDDGMERGEFTPIFWRRDRFEVQDRGTFWLASDPSQIGATDWGARIPRICSWVALSDRTTGESLWVMNTHFDHLSHAARVESARLLRQQAERIGAGENLVVTGDFNCNPESEPMQILTGSGGPGVRFIDSLKRSEAAPQGPSGTWNGFEAIQEGRRIDFVLVTEGVERVVSHQTLDPRTAEGRFASDHLPVTAKLQP